MQRSGIRRKEKLAAAATGGDAEKRRIEKGIKGNKRSWSGGSRTAHCEE